jgi:hypothetical protein
VGRSSLDRLDHRAGLSCLKNQLAHLFGSRINKQTKNINIKSRKKLKKGKNFDTFLLKTQKNLNIFS